MPGRQRTSAQVCGTIAAMKSRVLILGAGFGGLELATILSDALADEIDVTVIDKGDSFVFGYSKLDVMFRGAAPDSVRLPYAEFVKPGVRVLRETITAIDAEAKRVTTDAGTHEADLLVVALGADYDLAATPGLAESGDEFYSFEGAVCMRDAIRGFMQGRVVVGVCGAPFKCPPAPSECVLMLHDEFVRRGVRGDCEITLVLPFGRPVPPSPETSAALIEAFEERGIRLISNAKVSALDLERRVVVLDDESELPYDLFLGVPKHRAPAVVVESGLTVDGYVPVDPATLASSVAGVYAIGDCATQGTPKAGVFAEGAARALGQTLVAHLRGTGPDGVHAGTGSCYIEFGGGRIGRVDIDFLSGPSPTGVYQAPSVALRADKQHFGASRSARWFGRTS
jgi:sulfide:quinone oxidoreductase